MAGAKSLVDSSPEDDPDTEINHGCLLYKVRFCEIIIFMAIRMFKKYKLFMLQHFCEDRDFVSGTVIHTFPLEFTN